MFELLNMSSNALIREVIELVYFMRGSIQYEDMMYRTPGERDLISKFIAERLKSQEKSPAPVY